MRHDWLEAVQISGLKDLDYFTKFLLPISIPGLITGTIIGLGEGWEALVATEIIVKARGGLGGFFASFSQSIPITTFCILGLLLSVFSINKLVWLPLLEKSHHQMEE